MIVQGLLELPDARREEGENLAAEVNFVREENAKGLLPTTHIDRATLDGGTGTLRLESNSVEPADRLRKLVEEGRPSASRAATKSPMTRAVEVGKHVRHRLALERPPPTRRTGRRQTLPRRVLAL